MNCMMRLLKLKYRQEEHLLHVVYDMSRVKGKVERREQFRPDHVTRNCSKLSDLELRNLRKVSLI